MLNVKSDSRFYYRTLKYFVFWFYLYKKPLLDSQLNLMDNNKYHNFELLSQMEEQYKKIEELNNVINDMIKHDPDKHKLQEIELN